MCLGPSTSYRSWFSLSTLGIKLGLSGLAPSALYQVRHLARSDDDDEEDVDDACVWHMCLQVCCAYMHVHVCVHTCEGCWD